MEKVAGDYTSRDDSDDDDNDDDELESSFDLDATNESFDLEHLSSRIDSSVRESMSAEDENVREAANRLHGKMQSLCQLEEEEESEPSSTNFEPPEASYGACEHDQVGRGGRNSPDEGEEDEEIGETTSLLGGGSSDVQLRPSIFTTGDN